MGNLFQPNALEQLKGTGLAPQPEYQPGIVSRMLARGEDPSTLPKKSFLGGPGWKPPSPTWSPWDMWSREDTVEGAANANRSLSEAMAARGTGGTTPSSTSGFRNTGSPSSLITDLVSSQPVPGGTREIGTTTPAPAPAQREQVPTKRRRNRQLSPYGTSPGSMSMF